MALATGRRVTRRRSDGDEHGVDAVRRRAERSQRVAHVAHVDALRRVALLAAQRALALATL